MMQEWMQDQGQMENIEKMMGEWGKTWEQP
jgi:hypothetical protein